MTVVRRIARPMLAAVFIAGGIEQFMHPGRKAETTKPIVKKLAPLLGLPDDTELLVRANGAIMVGAGAMLTMGWMPRVASGVLAVSLLPSTLVGHAFWREEDPQRRAQERSQLLKNISLIGGALLASVDTEGRPGLAYRAHMAGDSVQRVARTTRREARHAAHSAAREARLKAAQAHNAIG